MDTGARWLGFSEAGERELLPNSSLFPQISLVGQGDAMRQSSENSRSSRFVLIGVLIAMLAGCQPPREPAPVPGTPVVPADADPPVVPEEPDEADEPVAAEVGVEPEQPPAVREPEASPAPAPVPDPEEVLERVEVELDGLPLYPLSVAVGPSGQLFVADHHLPGIWQVEEGRWRLFFQGEKTFRTPLNAIRCVVFDPQGNLLAGDSATGDVYRFNQEGQPESLTARDRPLGQITIPMAIAVEAGGDLLVADLGDHRLMRIPAAGGSVEMVADLPTPRGLYLDQDQQLWVISAGRLLRFSPDGEKETIVDQGVFEFPHSVVIWDEVAYVSDGYARTIWRVEPGQAAEAWVHGGPLENPVGLTLDEDRLLVADPRARSIFAIDAGGRVSPLSLEPAAP